MLLFFFFAGLLFQSLLSLGKSFSFFLQIHDPPRIAKKKKGFSSCGWWFCCCHPKASLLQTLPLLGLLYTFLLPSFSSPVLSLGLYSCCFGLPWPISSLLGSSVPFELLCPILFFWTSLAHFITFGLLCPILFFWASLTCFIAFGLLCPIRAPLSHLFSLGCPGPVCFPWASSALFLTSHHHGLLLNSLGFPAQLCYSSSLGFMGLPSTPYFLCFHYFGSAAAPFSFFHIIYCPWFAFSLFSGSFKPKYLNLKYNFIQLY